MSDHLTTVRGFVQSWVERLTAGGVPDARRSADWILQHVTGWSRAQLILHMDDPLSEAEARDANRLLERRIAREPLQYILAEAEFYGLTFRVTPDVLIPRPETEMLVDQALEVLRDRLARVLDVGTGSGCIACAVKKHAPSVDVLAIDVSAQALDVARFNAEMNGLEMQFVLDDVRDDTLSNRIGRFHLIISNPPYVPDSEAKDLEPEVKDFEPHLALFSGEDPLHYYRLLVRLARKSLLPRGVLLMETHINHAADVAEVAGEAGLVQIAVRNDLTGRPRVVSARQP